MIIFAIVWRIILLILIALIVNTAGMYLGLMLGISPGDPIGLAFGIFGTLLILVAMVYSLRKRWRNIPGKMKFWLHLHQLFLILGPILIIIHAGNRFESLISWTAMILMMLTVISGLIGRYVYQKVRRKIYKTGKKTTSLITTETIMKNWHAFHLPMTVLFLIFLIIHIYTQMYYRGIY